ncbi:DUF4326 domain-containing protein, partial [Streptomyces rectiviolaceus]
PNGYIFIGRGSGYGNVSKIGSRGDLILPGGWIDPRAHSPLTRQQAIDNFINSHSHDLDSLDRIRDDLRGKDLLCWCALTDACHGDWLLKVANSDLPVDAFLDQTPKPEHLAASRIRICRHPLRIVTHAPAWLACDTCKADFPHQATCPGRGTPGCAQHCMGGADPQVAALDALYALPAAERTSP